jgi:hypothetical protein
MPLYDYSIETLTGLSGLEEVTVISDCDNTLFDPKSGELYNDAEDFLAMCGRVALVSANPDAELREHRKQVSGAEVAVSSDRPVWNKARWFQEAISQLGLDAGSPVVILGDRAVADVWIGKQVAGFNGLDSFGIRIQRPEAVSIGSVDHATRIAYGFCRSGLELTRQAGRFRPVDNSPHTLTQFINRR